jgi:DNA-binding CsgD family transcriptional regulator/tetratricopeptide (TPR) repeat protein
MQAWPLTGRAEELAVITDVFRADGADAGVVIAGAAGVGKTRLAREAVAAARDCGWAVRWASGTLAAQSIPLGAFAQWADRLEGNPLQLVAGAIKAITTSPNGAPVLVVVDDARLLDNLSAFVLHQLVQRRAATVIATIRAGAPAPDEVTALWKDGHLRRLDLQPLSQAESDHLLQTTLGGPVCTTCSERMWNLTRGNVLFLHHLVAQEKHAGRLFTRNGHWRWEGTMRVSPSLADLVDSRMGAMPEPVLDVIDLVAVAEPLELAHLAALVEPAAIEDCELRGLIRVSHATPISVARLGHPLYGEVRQMQAGRARLERLRGRVARAVAAANGNLGAPDPVRLALLWQQSDLSPDRDVFTQAAQTAFRGLDMKLAERFAEAAIAAGASVDSELLRANALTLLSRGVEAEELLKSLTGRSLPEPTWSTAVSLRGVNLLWPLAQPAQSRKIIDDALASASEPVSHRLLAFRAVQLAVEANPGEALKICESVDRGELGAFPTLILTWAHVIALGDLGRPMLAAEIAEETAPLAAASPGTAYYQAIILVVYYTQALILGGCLEQALAVARRTSQHCADAAGRTQSFATAIRGKVALGHGDLPTAIECLRCAVADFADDTDGSSYNSGIDYAEALARSGDIDAADQALADMHRNRHPAHAYREADSLLAAAWLLAARGRTSEARGMARKAADLARGKGQHAREVMCLQVAVQFGDEHTAARLAGLTELVDGPRAGLIARWAAALGDHDGEALLAVSYDLEAMGDRIAAADAAAHSSLTFRREARIGPALTASGRADRLINECGAITPATQAAAMPLPFTDREREIAVLISQGMSNNEIAQTLTLSVRTIEGHVYRACVRVGAATRTELAQLITEFIPQPHDSVNH